MSEKTQKFRIGKSYGIPLALTALTTCLEIKNKIQGIGPNHSIEEIAIMTLGSIVMALIFGRIVSVIFRRKKRFGVGFMYFFVGAGCLCLLLGPIGWIFSALFIWIGVGFGPAKKARGITPYCKPLIIESVDNNYEDEKPGELYATLDHCFHVRNPWQDD